MKVGSSNIGKFGPCPNGDGQIALAKWKSQMAKVNRANMVAKMAEIW
jgi:hypothetical protein